jgi:hypothetical protein
MPSGCYVEGRGSFLAEARTVVFRTNCIPTLGINNSPVQFSTDRSGRSVLQTTHPYLILKYGKFCSMPTSYLHDMVGKCCAIIYNKTSKFL